VPTQLGKTNADNRQRLSDMNAKNRQASGNKPSKYQAKPSRDWTGLEEKAAAYLYEMVERDLNPRPDPVPELQNSRLSADDAYVAGLQAGSVLRKADNLSGFSQEARIAYNRGYQEAYGQVNGGLVGAVITPIAAVGAAFGAETIALTSRGLIEMARNASSEVFTGLRLLASRFRFFRQPIQESSRDIVERVTNEVADRLAKEGPQFLREHMTRKQWRAFTNNPKVAKMQLGQGVHNAINKILQKLYYERFQYFRKGPDFLDNLTGEYIEVTTSKQLTEHMKRYAEKLPGVDIKYVDYEFRY
jgi:hypothetical protein